MQEIWKDIEGYEFSYQVSNLGRIRSLTKKVIMCQIKTNKGYNTVYLYRYGRRKK